MKSNNEIIPELFDGILNNFKGHLAVKNNNRILFSGMFGIGKTTFINHFFNKKENKEQYNTIHLFPVNYTVLSNEDIFKYIKHDILLEMVEQEQIQFSPKNFNFAKDLPNFVKENLPKIFAISVLAISKTGRKHHKLYEELEKLYQDFHKKINQKELKAIEALKLIDYSNKLDGELYEANFITQLVSEKLKELKEENSKENVLIIDDLYRIDPNHIFRLFNVFTAHFDKQDFDKNKFGFDKIIFVCDIENIKKIFFHRYGGDTDFIGYIDKFYSKHVFHFDNYANLSKVLNKIIWKTNLRESDYSIILDDSSKKYILDLVHYFLKTLLKNNQVRLRTLWSKTDIEYQFKMKEIKFPNNQTLKCSESQLLLAVQFIYAYFPNAGLLIQAFENCSNDDSLPNLGDKFHFLFGETINILCLANLDGTTSSSYIDFNEKIKFNITGNYHKDNNLQIQSIHKSYQNKTSTEVKINKVNYFRYLSKALKVLKDFGYFEA